MTGRSSGHGPQCPLCDATGARHKLTQNGYHVFRCANCSLEFVAPIPTRDELARYYDQVYAVPLERYAQDLRRKEGHIIDLERWWPQRGDLLEVGASYGHSLALARARGWRVAGVELSPAASRHARERFGLDVHGCDLLDAPFQQQSFDAAILWHVLEHPPDPPAQLRCLWSLLRPGGVLGLRVPNAASFGARVAGRSWPWMVPPAHLWYFSPLTLPRLLARCGFAVLEVRTLRGDGNNFYHHTLIALGSRLNSLRRWVSRRAATAPAPATDRSSISDTPPLLQRAWSSALVRLQPFTDGMALLTWPLIGPLEAAGWGDELRCYARRPL